MIMGMPPYSAGPGILFRYRRDFMIMGMPPYFAGPGILFRYRRDFTGISFRLRGAREYSSGAGGTLRELASVFAGPWN